MGVKKWLISILPEKTRNYFIAKIQCNGTRKSRQPIGNDIDIREWSVGAIATLNIKMSNYQEYKNKVKFKGKFISKENTICGFKTNLINTHGLGLKNVVSDSVQCINYESIPIVWNLTRKICEINLLICLFPRASVNPNIEWLLKKCNDTFGISSFFGYRIWERKLRKYLKILRESCQLFWRLKKLTTHFEWSTAIFQVFYIQGNFAEPISQVLLFPELCRAQLLSTLLFTILKISI